ncbi:MAG: response regulator [Anaerolineae bacterium]|nr:response regulator [Anaerolineae bacterium]
MNSNKWHLLVVEDDPDGQEVVSTILSHLHIAIDVAGTAEEAENHLFGARQPYDAIIIDLALPGKDGWQLLSEIREDAEFANVPCIAVTAYHTSKLREQALTYGFNAYFPKPIDATSFSRALEDIL